MKIWAIVSMEMPDNDTLFEDFSDLLFNGNAHIVCSNVNGETLAELDAEVHQVSKNFPS